MADQLNEEGNIFDNADGGQTNKPSEVKPPVEVDKLGDLLKTIRNENGEQKYSSVEKALEALGHSQTFIPQLKTQLSEKDAELERIKNELQQRESVEQVVQRLIANKPDEGGNHSTTNGLDEQAVINLVKDTLQRTKQVEIVEQNKLKVQETLKSKFGDKAGEMVARKASELGTTPLELGELASKNPNLVLALFNTQGSKTPAITISSHNLPPNLNKPAELERPKKSLLAGATSAEQRDFMKQIRENVYTRHGIES